jgi:hypothetical protein
VPVSILVGTQGKIIAVYLFACTMIMSSFATAQTTVPYAEKTWESEALGGKWGLEVADIDQDGDLEILAMGSGNVINIYSAIDFSLKGNITISSSGGYFSPIYDLIYAAQADTDAALEIICKSSTINGGFKVIDGITKSVEWDYSGDLDHIAVADIDADNKAEIIAGGNAIEVFDVETQTSKGESQNITYYGNLSYVAMMRDIEINDVITGGNKEIVVLVDEFSGNGRLFILDSQTLEFKLNKSLSGCFQCMDLADIDSDGNIEIILGDGGVTLGTLSYFGHINIYDSTGTLEWGSLDLGEMITGIRCADIDNDGNKELVTASDRIKILNASNKSAIWSGTNLISVGDDDCLVLADIDGDGKFDILTRVDSYSAGNRALVYKVNGVVAPVDDTADNDTDGTSDGDTTGNGTNNETDSGSFLEDNLVMIVVAVVVIAAVVGAAVFIKKR